MPEATDYLPTGTLNEQENVFLEGGPDIYIGGVTKYAPDANGYYWGSTGTSGNPIYKAGCYENFQLSDNLTINEIRCDTTGSQGQIVRRNFLEATFDMKRLLPLSITKILLRWSSHLAVPGEDAEYAGIGEVNQNEYYRVYLPRVYDSEAGDWVSISGHRVQFAWTGALQPRYGAEWMVGVTMRMWADDSMPSDQRFATVVRYDQSAL